MKISTMLMAHISSRVKEVESGLQEPLQPSENNGNIACMKSLLASCIFTFYVSPDIVGRY